MQDLDDGVALIHPTVERECPPLPQSSDRPRPLCKTRLRLPSLPPSLGETMSSSEGGEPTLKCVCGLQGTSLQGEGEKQRMANTCDAKFLYLGKYIIGETGSSGCHYLLQSR